MLVLQEPRGRLCGPGTLRWAFLASVDGRAGNKTSQLKTTRRTKRLVRRRRSTTRRWRRGVSSVVLFPSFSAHFRAQPPFFFSASNHSKSISYHSDSSSMYHCTIIFNSALVSKFHLFEVKNEMIHLFHIKKKLNHFFRNFFILILELFDLVQTPIHINIFT